MYVEFVESGVDLIRRMQRGGDIMNSCITFHHVKHLHNWTTMAFHVYDNKHCKVLTIACCDMQSEDAHAQTLFWAILYDVMLENNVLKVNFKGFMADSSHAKWNKLRKVYADGDQNVPLEVHKHTCIFHWSTILDKIIQKVVERQVFGERA